MKQYTRICQNCIDKLAFAKLACPYCYGTGKVVSEGTRLENYGPSGRDRGRNELYVALAFVLLLISAVLILKYFG